MTPRPESYPRVPDDHPGPVLIEIAPADRQPITERFWGAWGDFASPMDATLYPNAAATVGPIRARGRDEGVDYPVDALVVLADEEARVAEFRRRVEGA